MNEKEKINIDADKEKIITKIENDAHHPTWEELCKLFPNKFKMEDKPENYQPELDLYTFQYGNKAIMLKTSDYNKREKLAMTHIRNQEDIKPIENQTTYIYNAIKNKLESIAKEENAEIEYILTTSNYNMARWIVSQGQQIFNWGEENMKILFKKSSNRETSNLSTNDFLSINDFDKDNDYLKVSCKTIIKPKK